MPAVECVTRTSRESDHGDSAVFMTRGLHTVARNRRMSRHRLPLALVLLLIAVSIAAAGAPFPQRLDGMTMCLPVIGPITRLDSTLSGHARDLVVVHERAHAVQCQEIGAVRSYLAGLTVAGKLRTEINAFCAEAYWDVAIGYPRENVLARIADELETAYSWTAGLSRGEIVAALGAACPPLSARARAAERG
jgi:hypothetical protein